MIQSREDSKSYSDKKAFFDNLLTIYGRKPVLEALQDPQLKLYKIHIAESNRPGGIIQQIIDLATRREIEVQWHNKKALSRISKNSKQDQGIAADIQLDHLISLDQFLQRQSDTQPFKLLALDNITNPQNLGMIIRSACAGSLDGIIIPKKGCAALSPLVIKASVGTLFKATLIRVESLTEALRHLQQLRLRSGPIEICTLSSRAKTSLFAAEERQSSQIYVLGNETDGVSREIEQLSDRQLSIPMNNGVESLNVAVTAALIAFYTS